MTAGWRRLLTAAVVLCVATCSRPAQTPKTSSPEIALPDLSGLAESVQQQIRERHDRLTQTLERPQSSAADRAEGYGAFGRVLMAAKFHDQAARCFASAEALAPSDMRWPYYEGHAFLRQGDRGQAAGAFERALKVRPNDVASLIWLGETYLDDDRLEQAQRAFQGAMAIQPQSAPALFGAGRTALAQRQFADAVQYLERALAADPRASAIHYPLAMAYRAEGDTARADAHLRQRGGAYPTLADPLMQDDEDLLASAVSFENRGMQSLRAGDVAAATAAFRQGLALDPNDVSLRYWLGAALYASADVDGAVREFSEVLRRDPNHAKAHFSLGAIDEARRDPQHALAEYRAAVAADPNMADARLRLAETLRAQGHADQSVEHYEAAVKLDPSMIGAWIGGARALLQLGRKDAAHTWLDNAKHVFPNRPELIQLESAIAE